jgi:hypothetical protein
MRRAAALQTTNNKSAAPASNLVNSAAPISVTNPPYVNTV